MSQRGEIGGHAPTHLPNVFTGPFVPDWVDCCFSLVSFGWLTPPTTALSEFSYMKDVVEAHGYDDRLLHYKNAFKASGMQITCLVNS